MISEPTKGEAAVYNVGVQESDAWRDSGSQAPGKDAWEKDMQICKQLSPHFLLEKPPATEECSLEAASVI